VEIAFGGKPLGQHYVVPLELDMVIGDALHSFLHHGRAVDQVTDRDQNIVGEHGVVRREPELARRLAGTERTSGNAHRPDMVRPRMAIAADGAPADPLHRALLSGDGGYTVALCQVL